MTRNKKVKQKLPVVVRVELTMDVMQELVWLALMAEEDVYVKIYSFTEQLPETIDKLELSSVGMEEVDNRMFAVLEYE